RAVHRVGEAFRRTEANAGRSQHGECPAVETAVRRIVGGDPVKAIEVPEISGAYLFEPTPHVDERGFFCRTFDAEVVRSVGIDPDSFAQDSVSRSAKGVLRGMHLRSGAGESKLVRCSYGEVFDVVVDLRPDSPTYRNRAFFELSGQTQQTIYIPAG